DVAFAERVTERGRLVATFDEDLARETGDLGGELRDGQDDRLGLPLTHRERLGCGSWEDGQREGRRGRETEHEPSDQAPRSTLRVEASDLAAERELEGLEARTFDGLAGGTIR